MVVKVVEIRDSGTFIPALAIKLGSDDDQERWLLAEAGYGRLKEDHERYILLCQILGGAQKCATDPYDWDQNPRTYLVAHEYIASHFDEIPPGGVVCVEHILGLRDEPKKSDRFWEQTRNSDPSPAV